MSNQKDSFWVGIPHEAMLAIAEEFPEIGEYLSWIALVLTLDYPMQVDPPPKEWARALYKRHVHPAAALADACTDITPEERPISDSVS